MWYFLKAFGIDPSLAQVEPIDGEWGSVKVAQHPAFGLELGTEFNQAVLESAYAVFEAREIRERLNFQGLSEERGLGYLYLLTYQKTPQALVWVPPGWMFDSLFYYPLRGSSQSALWDSAESKQDESLDELDSDLGERRKIEAFLNSFYGREESICRCGIPQSHFGMGQPGGFVRSFDEGVALPTVFTLDHPSSKTLIATLDRLISKQIVVITGKTVSEVGCGAGWITAQIALRGAETVHAYDLNLLKAANAEATARLYGIDDRVHAYRSRSATVLPPSALYVWNIPDFHEEQMEPSASAVMDQNQSIMANNRIVPSDAREVFDQIRAGAPRDALVLVRINSKDQGKFLELVAQAQWRVYEPRESTHGSSHEGGLFFLLQQEDR
jgi:predicted nicotinamide N-methyase